MAELDNKKKTEQTTPSFQEEYEKNKKLQAELNTEEKKGFFAKLLEGIKGFFNSLKEFLIDLFTPRVYKEVPEIKVDPTVDVSKIINQNEEDLSEEHDEEIDNDISLGAEEREDEDKINPFENQDIVDFVVKTESVEPDMLYRMYAMLKFEVTEQNKPYFAEFVSAMVDVINDMTPELEESSKLAIAKKASTISYDVVKDIPKMVETFNAFAKEMTGKDIAVSAESQEKIAKMYAEQARENFTKDVTAMLEGKNVIPEKVNEIIAENWNKIVAGELDEKTAKANIEKEITTVPEVAPEQPKTEPKKEEVEMDYSDYFDYQMDDDEVFAEEVVEESKFSQILAECKQDKDGRYIIGDMKTINVLIAEIKIDPEEPDPEMQYVKNTLVQARNIIAKGETAVWSQDGAEVYHEISIADRVFDDDVTIEDDDEPAVGETPIVPDKGDAR